MKKRYKLRSWVKTLLLLILLEIILISYLLLQSTRIQTIEETGRTENISVNLWR